MKSYTVNVRGDKRHVAKGLGLHSYYANGITAIEIKAVDKQDAKFQLECQGLYVLYVFE